MLLLRLQHPPRTRRQLPQIPPQKRLKITRQRNRPLILILRLESRRLLHRNPTPTPRRLRLQMKPPRHRLHNLQLPHPRMKPAKQHKPQIIRRRLKNQPPHHIRRHKPLPRRPHHLPQLHLLHTILPQLPPLHQPPRERPQIHHIRLHSVRRNPDPFPPTPLFQHPRPPHHHLPRKQRRLRSPHIPRKRHQHRPPHRHRRSQPQIARLHLILQIPLHLLRPLPRVLERSHRQPAHRHRSGHRLHIRPQRLPNLPSPWHRSIAQPPRRPPAKHPLHRPRLTPLQSPPPAETERKRLSHTALSE